VWCIKGDVESKGPIVGIGAVVIRDDNHLLMVRRGKEPAKGLWSLPGGRLERGEYIADAVAREVKEETGLDVEVLRLAGIFEVPGEQHYVILDYVAEVEGHPEPLAGQDADDARWVAFDDIEGLDCTPRLMETLRAWSVLTSAGEESD
jgi:ADP-ribose pyrophosphatase YjhB (NUDIX family)